MSSSEVTARSRLGIEYLSVFALPPVEYVNLAADLGIHNISTPVTGSRVNIGYPEFSLLTDKALRREMAAALRDRDVVISLGEGFRVLPGVEARSRAPELEAMCELGAKRINTVSTDPDVQRSFDQFAIMAEMVAAAGLETTTEFAPCLTVANLSMALDAVRHVGRKDFRLIIDTMHLMRSGSSPAELAALDPDLIAYVQLCDVPFKAEIPDYLEEARTERRVPGEGDLPLAEILNIVPRNVVVSLEVPELAKAKRGISHHDRLKPAVEAAFKLLDRLPHR